MTRRREPRLFVFMHLRGWSLLGVVGLWWMPVAARADQTTTSPALACRAFARNAALGMGARIYTPNVDDMPMLGPGAWVPSLDRALGDVETRKLTVGTTVILYTPRDYNWISLVALRPAPTGFCVLGTYGWSFGGRGSAIEPAGKPTTRGKTTRLHFKLIGQYRSTLQPDGSRSGNDDEVEALELELTDTTLTLPLPR